VVTNLVLNASEAVPRDGQVRIATSQRNGWTVLAVTGQRLWHECRVSSTARCFAPSKPRRKTGSYWHVSKQDDRGGSRRPDRGGERTGQGARPFKCSCRDPTNSHETQIADRRRRRGNSHAAAVGARSDYEVQLAWIRATATELFRTFSPSRGAPGPRPAPTRQYAGRRSCHLVDLLALDGLAKVVIISGQERRRLRSRQSEPEPMIFSANQSKWTS